MAFIGKQKLAHSVLEEIKRMIQNGEFNEGDKLPNQHEFAAQLGVSRTVLREALHTLTLLGVIEQRPKIGTVIRDLAPILYADHLTPPLMKEPRAIAEHIEARRFLEVASIELAIVHASDEQLDQMGDLISDMEKLVKNGDIVKYTEKNVAFHFLIAQASHNRFMVPLMATLRGFMERWMHESVTILPGLMERSYKAHKGIYEAIRNRNKQKAIECMKDHMLDLQQEIEKFNELSIQRDSEKTAY